MSQQLSLNEIIEKAWENLEPEYAVVDALISQIDVKELLHLVVSQHVKSVYQSLNEDLLNQN